MHIKQMKSFLPKTQTHSLNQVAKGLSWNKGDIVLTTDREHNSNLVPWLQLEEEQGIDHRVVASNDDNTFNMENFKKAAPRLVIN